MIRSILLNTSSNVLILFVKMALTFIMAPILIRNLGNYDYGLWEMFAAVIGYMGMLDLGIKPAISRFTAQHSARDEGEELQTLYSSAFLFMCFVGLMLAIAFIIWGLVFPNSLAQEGTESERYALLCFIFAAQFVFVFPGYVAESVLEGLQKYHIKNLITLINSLLGSMLIFNMITPENGLVLLAGINALGLSSKYLIYFMVLRTARNGLLKPLGVKPSLSRLKELIIFGSKSLVQGISTRIENATDSLVIGTILGPASVPFYSIPANLVGYIRTLSWTLTHVFMPVFSQLSATGNNALIIKTYLQGSRFVVAAVLLLSIGVITLGADFIRLWIGPEFSENAEILIIILVAFTALPMLNPFAGRYLTALNEHGIMAKWSPLSALLNIGLSIPLAYSLGIVGVALGSLIPIGIFVYIYMRKCCALLGIQKREYILLSVLPAVVPAILMFAAITLLKQYWPIDGYLVLLACAMIGSLTYLVAFFFVGLKRDERKYIYKKIIPTVQALKN